MINVQILSKFILLINSIDHDHTRTAQDFSPYRKAELNPLQISHHN
jgi:hypothetical protein